MELRSNNSIYTKSNNSADKLYRKHCLDLLDTLHNKNTPNSSVNNSQNRNKDIFVRSSFYDKTDSVENDNSYELPKPNITTDQISDEMYDAVNFGSKDLKLLALDKESVYAYEIYEFKGKIFSTRQMKPIPLNRCKEIKAVNNVLKFEENTYYKYTKENGEIEVICALKGGGIRAPFSNAASVRPYASYEKAEAFASLWAGMGSHKENINDERRRLDSVGIKHGFFTVEKSGKKFERFYSKGKYVCQVPKSQYDAKFQGLTQGFMLRGDHNPGDILKIDGKEYPINENYGVDIPYGADIYNIEYPKVKWA